MQTGETQQARLNERQTSAWRSFKEGDYKGAWWQSQKLNQDFPGFAPGWDISSRVALAMNQAEVALEFIGRALHIDGNRFAFLAQKANCLLALQWGEEALALVEKLGDADLSHAAEFDMLGNLYSLCKDQQRALACFEKAVELQPDNGHFQMNAALVRQSMGDLAGAESAMDTAIALDRHDYQAWLHRSRLRQQTTGNNHIADLESLLTEGTNSWREEVNIRYALAKEYEDIHDYRSSFRHLDSGSSLRRHHMRHDAQADLDAMDAIIDAFSEEFFAQSNPGFTNEEPVFIVGFPRTGTTLVERILGSHSAVYAAGELNNFADKLTRRIMGMKREKPSNRRQFIEAAARVNFAQLGDDYVQSTRPHTGQTARFIDKLPLNFLYCGLIATALPKARIIHLVRDPMDTCYAVYKTLFKQAYPFSYDLQELGRYFLAYQRLMRHWHQLMPGKILDVSYEELARNQEVESRRMISYCGLHWEDSCLDFHNNAAPSLTASLAQVRQPIYTTSIGRWRNYREELQPLAEILAEAGF